MWLFVGLGNPGDEHARNRHNIGFMAVDAMADESGASSFRAKFQGLVTESRISGSKVIFLKPQNYMNNSGQSVAACAKFYKIDPERIVIFYDELDLNPGQVRVKRGGGAAGHNGIRSIQSHLGTPDFWRVRLGIGHPGDKNRVSGYVLSDFSKKDQVWVDDIINSVARHAHLLSEEKESDFMSKVAMDVPAAK